MSVEASQDNSRFRQFVDLIHTDDELVGVDYAVHRTVSKLNADWPQIAWIWRGGNIARNSDGGTPIKSGNCFVKCPFVDNVDAEIHVWGETFEQAEDMRNRMLGALDRQLGQRFSVGGYKWWNEQEATSEWDVNGVKCEMTITAELLIATEVTPATDLVAAAATMKFQDAPAGSPIETQLTITVP